MSNLTIRLLAGCATYCVLNMVSACEPASLDLELFQEKYDLNHDGMYSQKEFQRVEDFYPYNWPSDKRFQGENKQTELFHYLDENKNGYLTNEELGNIHVLFNNPCEGWPWS
ncbi:calcium-binding protein [Acinetobacter sp. V115_6]|uniref:calcium-binding protein n=1 Tax=Acinetobacter sp. V115_6 TaxID=3072987 RepID=UPI00287F0E35|nr:calcium-binding protein [Acinetobacter sp. V115_6]MDS7925698.1 calcium-binding protein [Acinetobacter sp. V115_6]